MNGELAQEVKVIEGKKLVSRYGVISDKGEIQIFLSRDRGNPLVSLTICETTKINMVQNRLYCFQVAGEVTITIETYNGASMAQWINHILQIQCRSNGQSKEIFSDLKNEQTVELMGKLKQLPLFEYYRDEKRIKALMLKGEIPMCGWRQKWLRLREKDKNLPNLIAEQTRILEKQTARLRKVQAQVAVSQEKLDKLEEKASVRDFYDQFLLPIAKVEEELSSSFRLKLNNPQDFTVDDVSLFLCKCDLVELIAPFKNKNVDGEFLLSLSSAGALSELKIGDTLLEKQLEFFANLLEHRLLFTGSVESSLIWRHRPVAKTISLLKEHDVALDYEIISNKQISISQLIFFQVPDFKSIFGLEIKEAAAAVNRLKVFRRQFETFLAEPE